MKTKNGRHLYCMERTLLFESSDDFIDLPFTDAVPDGENGDAVRHLITLPAHLFILLVQVDIFIVIRFETHAGQTFQ